MAAIASQNQMLLKPPPHATGPRAHKRTYTHRLTHLPFSSFSPMTGSRRLLRFAHPFRALQFAASAACARGLSRADGPESPRRSAETRLSCGPDGDPLWTLLKPWGALKLIWLKTCFAPLLGSRVQKARASRRFCLVGRICSESR